MPATEIAEGVYRLGTKWANFYLVADHGEFALIDAGYPGYLGLLEAALDTMDASLSAVRSVVVTHHHVDHAGIGEAIRSKVGSTVLAHDSDAPMIRGERRSHVPPGFYRQAWRPSMARYLAHTLSVGGARYRPVATVSPLRGGERLDLPGRPQVIHTPGHTEGHCSLSLEERGVLFAGDALVNFDYASGQSGLGLHRFNDDRRRALASLGALAAPDLEVVLFGHGDPWTRGSREAVEIVRAQG